MNKTDLQILLDGLNELLAASKPRSSTARGWRIIREIRDAVQDLDLPDDEPVVIEKDDAPDAGSGEGEENV